MRNSNARGDGNTRRDCWMKIEFQVALTTEAGPILQEERTLVKENIKMPNKRRWSAYNDGSGFKLQV